MPSPKPHTTMMMMPMVRSLAEAPGAKLGSKGFLVGVGVIDAVGVTRVGVIVYVGAGGTRDGRNGGRDGRRFCCGQRSANQQFCAGPNEGIIDIKPVQGGQFLHGKAVSLCDRY